MDTLNQMIFRTLHYMGQKQGMVGAWQLLNDLKNCTKQTTYLCSINIRHYRIIFFALHLSVG